MTTVAWVHQITRQHLRAHAALAELASIAPPQSLHQGYHAYLLGSLAQDEGDPALALTLHTRAHSIAEAIGEPGLNVLTRLGLSRYHRLRGDAATAYAWANDAVGMADRVQYDHLRGMASIERGYASWNNGHQREAETDFRSAIEVLTPLRADFDLARAYLLLAALLHTHAGPPHSSTSLHSAQDAKAVWLEAMSRIISGGYAFLLEQERTTAFPLLADFLNDSVPPPPLHINALGRFEVKQRSNLIEPRAWNQRKAGELFGLLLISPDHTLSRDQIVEAVWSDKSIVSAQPLFHRATSALRRVLEPDLPDRFPSRYLEVDGGHVTLHLPIDSWLDFEVFEQHVQHGRLTPALDLYHGDLFPDDRYADWAAAPRERLNQLYLRVLIAQAEAEWESERFEPALDLCRRILTIEPWHERATLIGMKACLALNDRSGALRLYRSLEHTLHDELGIAPMLELRDFYQTLLS